MILAPAASLAVALALAPAVLAGPPTHQPSAPLEPLEFAPGEMCEDGLIQDVTSARMRTSQFVLRDGTIREVTRGSATSVLINTSTGERFEAQGGGRFSLEFRTDGSLVADASGVVFTWYYPGDPSELGPGAWVVMGNVHEAYDPDGTLVEATFNGRAVNACGLVGA